MWSTSQTTWAHWMALISIFIALSQTPTYILWDHKYTWNESMRRISAMASFMTENSASVSLHHHNLHNPSTGGGMWAPRSLSPLQCQMCTGTVGLRRVHWTLQAQRGFLALWLQSASSCAWVRSYSASQSMPVYSQAFARTYYGYPWGIARLSWPSWLVMHWGCSLTWRQSSILIPSTNHSSTNWVHMCVYFVFFCFLLHICCIIVSTVGWTWWDWSLVLRTYFLRCFDTVGWVIWPIKTCPQYDLAYNVFGGMLNLAQSNPIRRRELRWSRPVCYHCARPTPCTGLALVNVDVLFM